MAGRYFSPEAVAAWVHASCEEQGVPVVVRDPVVLAAVAVLVSGRAVPPGSRSRVRRDRPAGSESPDRPHPGGLDAAGSGCAGADDGVVEHGGHDLRLAG
jgi:hypothetical protein